MRQGRLVPKSGSRVATNVVALDCEMVGVRGRCDALARVCVVRSTLAAHHTLAAPA